MSEPVYDEDLVNLGYLKRAISDTEDGINSEYKNVSRHYASQPIPPYYKGDTWIDGNTVYTCINTRTIGLYTASDWVTESGATAKAASKNKTYVTQPSNYSAGDMWILQSDNDHRAGEKGEILISTAGRAVYDADDWVNMLGYGTITSINEVANNLNSAISRIGIVEEAIEDGIIITFYQSTVPEGVHVGDLWYVTGTVTGYTQGKIYRYNGSTWDLLDDPAIQEAFDEANEARLVADGKIQSFYSATEPISGDIGVGDLWIDTAHNNQLYRYNGTNWVACYDTRINGLVTTVESTTERVSSIETDLGEIDLRVEENTTTITTMQGDIDDIDTSLNNVINTMGQAEGKEIYIDDASNEPLVDIKLNGKSTQATRSGKNLYQGTDISATGAVGCNLLNPIQPGTYTISAIASSTDTDNDRNLIYDVTNDKILGYLYRDNRNSFTFTTDKIINKLNFYASSKYDYSQGDTFSFKDIQIESGSVATDYEQYGASPSPEFPSEIENVEGWNLIDYKTVLNTDNNTIVTLIDNGFNTKGLYGGKIVVTGLKKNTDYRLQYILQNIIGNTRNVTVFANQETTTAIKHFTTFTGGIFNTGNYTEINIWFYGAVGTYGEANFTNIQLVEGSEEKPYAPYSSLVIENIGTNLFDNNKVSSLNKLSYENGVYSASDNDTKSNLQYKIQQYNNNAVVIGTQTTKLIESRGIYYYTLTKQENADSLRIANSGATSEFSLFYPLDDIKVGEKFTVVLNIIDIAVGASRFKDVMLLKGEITEADYEKHKSQTEYFPLTKPLRSLPNGVKDTIEEDGIHRRVGTGVFQAVTQVFTSNGLKYGTNTLTVNNLGTNTTTSNINILCDRANCRIASPHHENDVYIINRNTLVIFGSADDTVETFNEKFAGAEYTYELAEEVVEPFTEEQQEAYNQLQNLTLFEGVNHISSDAYANITYMRNNGLNVYETRYNAQRKYVETTKKFAEQQITNDSIRNTVSETVTRLNNDYLTAEQVEAEIDTTKEDIEILKQKQATTELTTDGFRIEIDNIINNGVSKVQTSMGYTFDDEGLKINKSNAETGTVIDEAAIKVLDKTSGSPQNLLYAGYVKPGDINYPFYIGQTIVASANMIVQNYLVVPNSRFEAYENPVLGGHGTGVFEI